MKKSLITIIALLGMMTLGACTTSSGIAHLGEGKVAVSVNSMGGNKKPIIYDCSGGGTCVRVGGK